MVNSSKDSVCVLFSGGSDSSLVAYRMSQKFDTVHLITLIHSYQTDMGKSSLSFSLLDKKIPGKFKHIQMNMDEIMMQIYRYKHFKYLIKYGILNMLFGCFACQASFHVNAIIYCKKNNIFNVSDGANTEYGDSAPMQIEIVNAEMKKLYADYGIRHESPIYHEHKVRRSDQQLYELGLRPEVNEKANPELYYKYQGSCKLGSQSAIGLYYLKNRNDYPNYVQTKIKEHWIDVVPFLKNIIDEHLSRI